MDDYKMKKEAIEKAGWVLLYGKDYWVHYELMAGADIDKCGVNLKTAYEIQTEKENGTDVASN